MDSQVELEKKRLRELQKQRLGAIPTASRRRQEELLCRKMMDLWEPRVHPWVLGFMSLPDEPDLSPFWEHVLRKGHLALPRTNDGELSFHEVVALKADWPAHPWGLREPAASFPAWPVQEACKTLVLVPGLAFDGGGNRLGRGGGYYDRFLSRWGKEVLVWGVGWIECEVQKLPVLEHDVQLAAWVGPQDFGPLAL